MYERLRERVVYDVALQAKRVCNNDKDTWTNIEIHSSLFTRASEPRKAAFLLSGMS